MPKTHLLNRLFIIILPGLIVAWCALAGHTKAQTLPGPTNVGLISFEVTPLDNAVRLEWTTATELGTAGFILKRGSGDTFDYLENIGFIESEGGPSIGATYEVVDETALNGETYTYKLFEVESNTNEVELDEQTVTLPVPTATATSIIISGQASPTYTPTASSGGNQGNTPTASHTPTAGATQAATSQPGTTPQPAATASGSTPVSSQAATATVSPNAISTQPPPTAASLFNQQIAQAQEEPTAEPPGENGYPGPDEGEGPETAPDITQETEAPPPQSPAAQQPTAYPATVNAEPTNTLAAPVPVIGNQEGNAYQPPATAPAPAAQSSASRTATAGRLYLWGGFLAALVLFITSILGSIILFTRRREAGP